MEIFISHSSKNYDLGNALVDLLVEVGIRSGQIIFTSNPAYGIPVGHNIFDWLKSRISNKPYVIYLLSPEYYTSVACLNEMGAAWIIENEHSMIFTPNFQLNSPEFQNGAINPREIGFYIDNEDRLLEFIDFLLEKFDLPKNMALINQRVKKFLNRIKSFPNKKEEKTSNPIERSIVEIEGEMKERTTTIPENKQDAISKFLSDWSNNKVRDEEFLLIYYIIENTKFYLATGVKSDKEINNIKDWESENDMLDTLSKKYLATLRRFELRNIIEMTEEGIDGKPQEVTIIKSLQEVFIDMPEEMEIKLHEIVKNHSRGYSIF